MTAAGPADPQLVDLLTRDIRPVVAQGGSNRPLWIGIGTIALAGFGLFLVLNTARENGQAPAVRPSASELALAPSRAQPELYVPPETLPFAPPDAAIATFERGAPGAPVIVRPITSPAPPPAPTQSVAVRDSAPTSAWQTPPAPSSAVGFDTSSPSPAPAPADLRSAIIVDGGVAASTAPGSDATGTALSPATDKSVNGAAIAVRPAAQRAAARALIVPQGTLISAVLETALDSTQPGQARALVSSDIRASRSTRVLIPRGSRLFGSYQGELAAGQSRVLVQWSRLVRPDGVTITIDSPASDRLGRAGIKGHVRSYFWQRLGGALLQSAIDVGSILAARGSYSSPILVAVPGRVSGVASDLVGAPPKPSVTVPPGTQVSVFAVRDLDFSAVEGLP